MNINWTKNRNYNETWGGNADVDSVALYNLVDDPKEELNLAKNDTMAEKATKMEMEKNNWNIMTIARMIDDFS